MNDDDRFSYGNHPNEIVILRHGPPEDDTCAKEQDESTAAPEHDALDDDADPGAE